ncbi:Universal stress protein UspA-like protein [Arthrobacter sp. 9AX]|uniref:universal stress protein n=1 Tax=Arthrobacter sp. 9AX TaxID=2653131 RepID=UPI0012F051C8|nr:universal stress protein [Arthrobacter sp. 9AX]VXC23439.1 Universal stress protein UspA-like protein [Arthrobacter sp. 9AX]
MQEPESIVVGYDGSDEAGAAVRWAAQQAHLRRCALKVVHCSIWPLLTRNLGPVPGVADSGLERSAEVILEEGVNQARAAVPDLDTGGTLLHGLPASHLARISAGERMLVVGSRGLGGFLGLLVGSVSLELAASADCPVAVIRSDLHPTGPVIAAVDASGSPTAVEDAHAVAAAFQARLNIVHVRHPSAGYRPGDANHAVTVEEAAEEIINSAVYHARSFAPGVHVEGRILTDTSVPHALLKASAEARMLVVGTKGHGFVRETIGSTAHAVLHQARGPVLISRRGAGNAGPDSEEQARVGQR